MTFIISEKKIPLRAYTGVFWLWLVSLSRRYERCSALAERGLLNFKDEIGPLVIFDSGVWNIVLNFTQQIGGLRIFDATLLIQTLRHSRCFVPNC